MTDRSPPQRLSPGRIEQVLADFPDWRQRDGAFVRSYRFADFRQAMRFVADVADLAEAHQHHPDWSNRYARVEIAWTTHDQGGVTDLDVAMLRACEALARTHGARDEGPSAP
mgnify:FL=1